VSDGAQAEIDLNNRSFQAVYFYLEPSDGKPIHKCFRKLMQMTWSQVYVDSGLKWERVKGVQNRYSIRLSQKARAVVIRRGNAMCFESLHFDHDSAYE
jgi:hypothetical protein